MVSASVEQVVEKRTPRIQVVFETGLIIAGLVAMFMYLPFRIFGDGTARFQAISDLLEHGKISDMQYSIVGPLFSAPFWLLGRVYETSEWWCERYNLFFFTLGLLVTYWLLKDRVDRGLLRRFFLILVAASMFADHISTYYGEVFTAVCVGMGILLGAVGPALRGWIAVVLGVVNTPASIIGLGCVVLTRMWENKRWRYVLVFIAAVGLILAENWIRRGNLFDTGYDPTKNVGYQTVMPYSGLPGFSYPFFFGVLSILLSFGKGLFFFAPGLLLPIRGHLLSIAHESKSALYSAYKLWISFLVGLVLIYAQWWSWYGGWFWGPRFFLFASIPASFALAVCLYYRNNSLVGNLLTFAVLCLSVWVGIDGAVFSQRDLGACITRRYFQEFLCHYTPEFSVLWHPFVVQEHLAPGDYAYIGYSLVVFAYLAIPLLRTIVEQAIVKAESLGRVHLNFRLWRL